MRGDDPIPQSILDAAAKLFWANGYDRTTTREIAAAAGLKPATLYHHVSSKEEMLFALSLDGHRRMIEAVKTELDKDGAPIDTLREGMRAHMQLMLEELPLYAATMTEFRSLSTALRAEIVIQRDEYEALWTASLRRAQAAGELRRDMDARVLCLSFLSQANWSIFWYSPDGMLSVSRLADRVATLFLEGAAPRG
jgi:TetR/AcrR family transcriptional regulator, cholesterol catabolism regulator